jgi:hypothetical protein
MVRRTGAKNRIAGRICRKMAIGRDFSIQAGFGQYQKNAAIGGMRMAV